MIPSKQQIHLVGMGPGHIDHVTGEALKTIQNVEKNIAFGRIAETARQITPNVEAVNSLEQIIELTITVKNVAILASGDACFFGILDFLKSRQIKIDKVIPGITSFQYMMNRLQKSWHGVTFFSLHGRIPDYQQIRNCAQSIILTDKDHSPDAISQNLYQLGSKGTVFTGFDLSYSTEVMVEKAIGDHIPPISRLSTILVEIE